jgi:hypothetical protein
LRVLISTAPKRPPQRSCANSQRYAFLAVRRYYEIRGLAAMIRINPESFTRQSFTLILTILDWVVSR